MVEENSPHLAYSSLLTLFLNMQILESWGGAHSSIKEKSGVWLEQEVQGEWCLLSSGFF